MALWSGNLPAISTEGAIAFLMIHEPSGQPIKYLKGIETDQGFEEVPEEEIIRGYEHAKGHHVLIEPKELDDLKLEAKHTIDHGETRTRSTAAISKSPTTFCRMVTKPTRATLSF